MSVKAEGYFIKHHMASKYHLAMCIWLPPETYDDRRDFLVKRKNLHPSIKRRTDLTNRFGAISRRGIVFVCECRYEKGEREAAHQLWFKEVISPKLEIIRKHFSNSEHSDARSFTIPWDRLQSDA